jgi:hypothetical protein
MEEAPPPRRPRFSLLTLLLLTTIVGLAIVVGLQWRELDPLRRELRQLRSEVGHLTIDDPTKAYAIAVPAMEDNHWRWRLYLPPGRQRDVFVYSGHLPRRTGLLTEWLKGVVDDGVGMSTSGSDFVGELTFECRAFEKVDQWTMHTRYGRQDGNTTVSGGGGTTIHQQDNWFAEGLSRMTSSDVGHGRQQEFEADAPIVLLHIIRPVVKELPGGGHTSQSPTGSADGVVVWIQPRKAASSGAAAKP